MQNIKIVIEYDGTDYVGWQKQPNGISVQERIEDSLNKITGEKISLIGSGRTDSGVHALGQVANFNASCGMSDEELQRALNSTLPPDIAILDVERVPEGFHSQHGALSKSYLYRILNRPYKSALERNRLWLVVTPLNIAKMEEALELFRGEHDFRAFALAPDSVRSTVREVLSVGFREMRDIIEIEIEATGFLKRMVRLIVGALVSVGKEKIDLGDISTMIASGNRSRRVLAAPPQGLFLKRVNYPSK